MIVTGTCGHQVDVDTPSIAIKDFDKEGKNCVAHVVYCDDCKHHYEEKGHILYTEDEEHAWLDSDDVDVFGEITIAGQLKRNGWFDYRGHYILECKDSVGPFYLIGVLMEGDTKVDVLGNPVHATTRRLNGAIDYVDEEVESKSKDLSDG